MLWHRCTVEVDEGSAAFACTRLRVLSPQPMPLIHTLCRKRSMVSVLLLQT
jgi:hypothetical protein